MPAHRTCPLCGRAFDASDFDAATGWWECAGCQGRVFERNGPAGLGTGSSGPKSAKEQSGRGDSPDSARGLQATGRMKSKVIGAAVLLAIGSLVVYLCVHWIISKRAEEAERQRVQHETRDAVSQLAASHNAVVDWEERLGKGKSHRSARVLTIELEPLWQGEHPVLFVGCIRDVSSDGVGAYQVVVDRDVFGLSHTFTTEFRLSLRAPKATIDSFLQQYPDALAENTIANGVAVVARIASISTTDERGVDGDRVETKAGHGELLGIVFTGNVFFQKARSSGNEPND